MFKLNRFLFILIDFLLITLFFLLLYRIRYSSFFIIGVEERTLSFDIILLLTAYSLIFTVFNISMKIYELNKITKITESFLSCIYAAFFSMIFFGFYFYFTQTNFARFVFFTGFLSLPLIIAVFNKTLFLILNKNNEVIPIIYIGTKKKFLLLSELFENNNKWFKYDITKNFIENKNIHKINIKKASKILYLDMDINYTNKVLKILSDFENNMGKIYSLADVFDFFDQSLPVELIENSFYINFTGDKLNGFYARYFKRIIDIIFSFVFLIILSPLFILIMILLKLTLKENIFFLQKRATVNNKNFLIIKFKTMKSTKVSKKLFTEKNDKRLTFLGKLLRSGRLDELPQLFNVLKGDMSLIGPRPERPELMNLILKKYPYFKKRLLIKPGLTGWAQVKFDYVSKIKKMNKKLSYDLYYIKNVSFAFDIKIILYTFETIIFRRGAV